MANPDCDECHGKGRIDHDPGDPEVGPDPDVQPCWTCFPMGDEFEVALVQPHEIGPSWEEIVDDRDLVHAYAADFGLADTVIALLTFNEPEGASFEVGAGESLRPYQQHYKGDDRNEAITAFWKAVSKRATFF